VSIDDVVGPFGAPVPEREVATQLRADELNLFDSTAVAISSVAPAYSIASTASFVFVIAGVGLASPAIIVLSFVPVLFVAISYFHLNRRNPNCGASYAWLSQVVHPAVGWYNGWVQVATSVLFCTLAPLLAGQYTLLFMHKALHLVSGATAHDQVDIAVAAAVWLLLVTFICVYGIRWTTNFQWVFVVIEFVCVIGFSVGGIIKVALDHPAHSRAFHWGWVSPLSIHGWSAVASGLALGVFFFWGWDTALNLNEESQHASHMPGRAAVLSMWLLVVIFTVNLVAMEMLLPGRQIANQGTGILFYFGQQFAGSWASYVMVFAVLSSTVATTQTTLLPAARITFSMARDRVFPRLFGTVHERFKTPALGTVVLAMIALFGILLTTLSTSAQSVFNNLLSNIGVLVAFYYGVTGLACAWAFRRTIGKGPWANVTMVLAPLLGGLALLFVCYQVIKSGGLNALPDDIILLAGIPLTALARWRTIDSSPFFRQPTVAYDTID
jgi:amino acid transporter